MFYVMTTKRCFKVLVKYSFQTKNKSISTGSKTTLKKIVIDRKKF